MSHFAKIESGIVTEIITAEQDFIDLLSDAASWIQTSYNTRGGINSRDGGTPLRKNYAGIGYTYDSARDAFISPKPYPSWLLNESTCQWYAPVALPTDNQIYQWDESSLTWKVTTI
jgi:hypothetical protein